MEKKKGASRKAIRRYLTVAKDANSGNSFCTSWETWNSCRSWERLWTRSTLHRRDRRRAGSRGYEVRHVVMELLQFLKIRFRWPELVRAGRATTTDLDLKNGLYVVSPDDHDGMLISPSTSSQQTPWTSRRPQTPQRPTGKPMGSSAIS
jgi:hypothetical protein